MNKLLHLPTFYGPIITVLFTVIYHAAALYFGFAVNLVWLAVFVVIGSFIGGLGTGFVAAAWAIGYALYAIPVWDQADRAAQVIAGMMVIAGVVGYLRWRERRLQRAMIAAFANGNVAKVREALALASAGQNTNDPAAAATFEKIESNLGNTLAVLDGYRFLREEIETVNRWYANPKNAAKVKRWEGEK